MNLNYNFKQISGFLKKKEKIQKKQLKTLLLCKRCNNELVSEEHKHVCPNCQ